MTGGISSDSQEVSLASGTQQLASGTQEVSTASGTQEVQTTTPPAENQNQNENQNQGSSLPQEFANGMETVGNLPQSTQQKNDVIDDPANAPLP